MDTRTRPKELPPFQAHAVVIDCKDSSMLSDFYTHMLGWKKTPGGSEWTVVAPPGGGISLVFHENPGYMPPVWPEEQGKQQIMEHVDFKVRNAEDMLRAVDYAISCGARKARLQYIDHVTIMIDPEGHPFSFVIAK